MLHKSLHPASALSLAKWMCHVRMKWGKRATWGDRDLLTKQFFTQAPNRILDVFFVLFCAVRETDVTPEFHMLGDDPKQAWRESGWSAVTTEPFAGPQPLSQSPAEIRHLPLCRDFRGASLSHSALSTVLNEPNPTSSFTQSYMFVFFIWEYTHRS